MQELSAQWQAYKENNSQAARDELINAYSPLVRQVAGRLFIHLPTNANVDFGDLVGYGMLGLLDAMKKYEPGMGVKFRTYAVARIRGAIIDGLRTFDWAPRTLRQKARQIGAVITSLEKKLGRSAEDEEVAKALGLSRKEYEALLGQLAGLTIISLQQPLDAGEDDPVLLGEILPGSAEDDPDAGYEQQELLQSLTEAIALLPERERQILALYYYEEMTLKEIGIIMEISESRVCQLHTKALLRLRHYLEEKELIAGMERRKRPRQGPLPAPAHTRRSRQPAAAAR
ncbi:MAG TPA: FliA/WhiG family RNA polymerase sigma factor [Firmicutes bacterium]|nr:FliA/WhiG family RNA polymerase sigma factor [Bacillota bacterium]